MFSFKRHSSKATAKLRSASAFALEGLEGRQLLSAASVGLNQGVLTITGTSHGDVVSISPSSHHASVMNVTVDGSTGRVTAADTHGQRR